MPHFSFDTVPVYMHTCNVSGAWNNATLEYFTKFPLITFEKGQGVYAEYEPYTSQYAEDKIIEACKQIKSIKPDIICLFYYNHGKIWTMYKLQEIFAETPSYQLRDDDNRVVLDHGDGSFPQPDQGMFVPDFRQSVVQKLMTNECVNLTQGDNYGIVDGCFIDDPGKDTFGGYKFTQQELAEFKTGHDKSMTDTQAALNKSNASVVIINNGYQVQGMTATMLQKFYATEQYIQQLLSFSKKGILVEVYARNCSKNTDITDTLSAFLIGMNKYSYYACADGWQWPDNWNTWYPDYDKPLGEPMGDAVKSGDVYTRSFKSGTKVSFDTKTNKGSIQWGSSV